MRRLLGLALSTGVALAMAGAAQAQNVHTGPAASPISASVLVPTGSDTLYVSGMVPSAVSAGPPAEFGDTKTQTLSVLKKIDDALKAQGFGMGDVVMMRVFLVGDPAKGGKMDFAGMMEAYNTYFGTAAQPKKPARITVQVAALVAPGMLAEIEVQAARPRK